MVFEVLKVRRKDKSTKMTYDVVPQLVQDIGINEGKWIVRLLVGILNYQEFSLVHAIYDSNELNEKYDVLDIKYIEIDNELIINTNKTVSISITDDTISDQIDPDLNPNHDPVDRI